MYLKHFWMKQKESICLNVTLKSSVMSGWTQSLKPGKSVDRKIWFRSEAFT